MSARGPTRLISPRTTLTSCGSSSRLVRRRKRPLRVMRGSSGRCPYGSSLSFCACPTAIASLIIVRNLYIRNSRPSLPDARVREQHGAARLEEDPERDDGEHRAEHDQRDRGEHAVERVLQPGGRRVRGRARSRTYHRRSACRAHRSWEHHAAVRPQSCERARASRPHRRSAHVSLSVRARSRARRLSPRRALPSGQRQDTRAQSALALALRRQGRSSTCRASGGSRAG